MATPTDRLLAQLNQTQLAQKDNPVYQVIKQLIGIIKNLEITVTGGSGGGGGGTTLVTNNIFHQFLSSDDGGGGEGGDTIIINQNSGDGTNSMVPYFIASDETFTVPEFKQALFAMTIDNEGILDVEGFLIEVE